MLDPHIRPFIDPPLDALGKGLVALGISANAVTLLGFLFGLIAIALICITQYHVAMIFLALNRLSDGLDGAIARDSGLSDFGGFLDIVCDFIVYAGVVFAFAVAVPDNAFYAAFLIFSFIGPMVSFLAYATIAAKHNINTTERGRKSFYYLGGICEGTETTVVLFLLCLFPRYFTQLSLFYGVLCWLTTLGRMNNARIDFGK